jgi:hypothetical protein
MTLKKINITMVGGQTFTSRSEFNYNYPCLAIQILRVCYGVGRWVPVYPKDYPNAKPLEINLDLAVSVCWDD